jgi:hypothetical protein
VLEQRRCWVDADSALDRGQPSEASSQDAGATPAVQHADGTRNVGETDLPHGLRLRVDAAGLQEIGESI